MVSEIKSSQHNLLQFSAQTDIQKSEEYCLGYLDYLCKLSVFTEKFSNLSFMILIEFSLSEEEPGQLSADCET